MHQQTRNRRMEDHREPACRSGAGLEEGQGLPGRHDAERLGIHLPEQLRAAQDAAMLGAALEDLPVRGHKEARDHGPRAGGADQGAGGVGEDLLACALGVTDDGVDDGVSAEGPAEALVLQEPRDLLLHGHLAGGDLGRAEVLGHRGRDLGYHGRVAHEILRGPRE